MPFLVAGGTYAQALDGSAKAIIRHDGNVKFTDGEFTGIINAMGGNIGVLDIDINGNLKLIDITDPTIIRLLFSKSNIPLVASILSTTQYGQSVTNPHAVYSTDGKTILPYTLSVTQDSSTLTFNGQLTLFAELDITHDYTSGEARVDVLLYKNGIPYINLGFIEGFVDENHLRISEEYASNKSIIVGIGNYAIAVRVHFDGVMNQYGGISGESIFSWTFNKDIRRFEFGVNGFLAWYTNTHMHFTETGGFDGKAPSDKWNAPGVLLSGTISSAGSLTALWGAKKSGTSPVKNSTGRYTVYHTVGHSNYQIFATPHSANKSHRIVSKSLTNFVIEWRSVGSSPTFVDTAFDFQIVGNNYS